MATYGLTLNDIWTRVSSGIGLDNTAGSAEQLLMTGWANEACLDILERTKVKVEQAQLTLVANQGDYEVPAGVLVMNTLTVTNANDGQVVPLEPIPIEELIWRRRYPGAVPVRYYAMQGWNLLSLYPTPASPDTLNIYYVPVPATLVNSTDQLTSTGIPPHLHYLVELYVRYKAGEYNDYAASQNGMLDFQKYEVEVKKARGRVRREQGNRRPPALAGRRTRRKYYPAYPSQDTGVSGY